MRARAAGRQQTEAIGSSTTGSREKRVFEGQQRSNRVEQDVTHLGAGILSPILPQQKVVSRPGGDNIRGRISAVGGVRSPRLKTELEHGPG